jgi:hypothetical protein
MYGQHLAGSSNNPESTQRWQQQLARGREATGARRSAQPPPGHSYSAHTMQHSATHGMQGGASWRLQRVTCCKALLGLVADHALACCSCGRWCVGLRLRPRVFCQSSISIERLCSGCGGLLHVLRKWAETDLNRRIIS